MRKQTPVQWLTRRVMALFLVLVLAASLCVPAFAAGGTQTVRSYEQRAKELLQQSAVVDLDESKDPDEVVRAMVVTEAPAAVEQVGTVAYTGAVQQAEKQTLRSQQSVIARVQRITGNPVINQSAYLVSAFSMDMTRAQMKQVAALEGVASVSEVTTYQARMTTAKDMTSAMELWKAENGGYTGEGIVVAIIDSGVNYTHPDMQMREDAELKFTKDEMSQKIAELGYGAYYSDKVPFGYSYVAEEDINNRGVTHGLHVAGIVAANGDESADGVVGIAPDAQVFAMQVFGSSGSGYNDDIIRAVEDSVKLGADILNLSLGGGPGFYDDVDYLQKALAYAEENGVLVCVAAGNEGSASSDMGTNSNDWGVVDTGAVSSPSTFPGALSVASVDNAYQRGKTIGITSGDESVYSGLVQDFSEGKNCDWSALVDVPVVDMGYGDLFGDIFPLMFGGGLPEGDYVALVQRGNDITFEDKISNAAGFGGAAAVIVYNNEATDEVPDSLSAGDSTRYAAVMVSGNTGERIKELALAGGTFTFTGLDDALVPSSTGGSVSSFSSWGSTPTLDIKPEIAAPGGNIYSLSSGTDYEVMSGTSMATPYVAGCSALVLEALQDAVAAGTLQLGDTSLSKFLKSSMMNTATPIYDGEVITSVRQQGSGLVDPAAAAANRVIASYEGEASVALREVGSSTSFVITLRNYGTQAASYTLPASVPVYTDYTDPDDATYGMQLLSGASVRFDSTAVTVPAGGSVQVTATLVIPESAAQDHYVEAFLTFSGDVSLSLPLLGFYGDWYGCQRIVDLPAWDEENILSNYYDYLPVTTVAAGSSYAGFDVANMSADPEHIAFSPNGDGDFDNVQPILGVLRSAEEIIVDVLDEDGQVVRQINRATQVSKAVGLDSYESRSAGVVLAAGFSGDGTWDGTRYDTATGETVLCPEGQYTLRVRARMPGSELVETTLLPVKLDLTAPEVKIVDAYVVDEQLYLTYTAEDYSGVMNAAVVYVNGEEEIEFVPSDEAEYDEATGIYSVVLPVSSYVAGQMNEIALTCLDYAYNGATDILYIDPSFESDVVFFNIPNDDSLCILRDISYRADYDFDSDSYVNIRECTAQIRGIASSQVASISINGAETTPDQRGAFRVVVPVEEPGLLTLQVVARDKDGQVVFQTEKSALFDVNSPSVLAYVADENGEWDLDMLWTTAFTLDGYIYATRYDKDELVPLRILASDEALQSLTVSWLGGEVDQDQFSNWLWGMDPDEGVEVHSQEIDVAELEKTGYIDMTFPFAYKSSVYEGPDGEIYDYSANCQVVRVEATDLTGNRTLFNALLYDNDYGETFFEENGYQDVRDSDNKIRSTIVSLDPLWTDAESLTDTTFMLDESLVVDGKLHAVATLDRDVNFLRYDGVDYTPEEGSRQVELDITIQPGLNIVYLQNYSTLFSPNDFRTTYKLYLYYLPDSEPLSLRFDDERIADGATIYTSEEQFKLSGEILSRYGDISLKINDDILRYPSGDIQIVGDPIRDVFSYDVALTEGVNKLSVKVTDATETEIQVDFTVVLDTQAPEAPVISQDEAGLVSITSGEEDVTLYYSYDGQEWISYTGPFEPRSTPVYAVAVDQAGNRSDVAQLDVKVSDSVKAGDESGIGLWLCVLTAAALGVVAVLPRRRRS